MNKMCTSCLGVLLLTLYLSSQTEGQTPTTTMTSNVTMTPKVTMIMSTHSSNMTSNVTQATGGCGRTDGWTVLLPLTLSASLLHIWS